ncbi:MAG: winged helix-turn-helix transcriptional regulator [Nanoarchaeota archaeon]|nr:winged helix-turn-helix transcriptional regulator [Nanoarchaeota archaeon]
MENILKSMFDEKTISVLSEIPGRKTIGIREISRKTNIPVATVYRIFKKLEKSGLLKKTKSGVFSFYEVNQNSKAYLLLERLIPKKSPLDIFTTIVSKEKTEEIHLLDEGEDRASLLVIGNVKTKKVQEICDAIKKEFGYSIKPLVLTRAQYENMVSLNIAPASKKLLFKKQNLYK